MTELPPPDPEEAEAARKAAERYRAQLDYNNEWRRRKRQQDAVRRSQIQAAYERSESREIDDEIKADRGKKEPKVEIVPGSRSEQWAEFDRQQREATRRRLQQNAAARAAAPKTGDEPWHGTPTGYGAHHCRCPACTAANSAQQAARRATARANRDMSPTEAERVRKISGAAQSRPRNDDGTFVPKPYTRPFGDVLPALWQIGRDPDEED